MVDTLDKYYVRQCLLPRVHISDIHNIAGVDSSDICKQHVIIILTNIFCSLLFYISSDMWGQTSLPIPVV
jgi:hypothetical protein